ncbi:hypothetical protein [Pigmentiphaga litoralis]|uniref:hypothetical protein n=1 Tax=Pigmentiphaga litoralis TaxID=516702 RepID=UPI0016787859|nr:hypothetical protein [Pigmentiphaga litoralis]
MTRQPTTDNGEASNDQDKTTPGGHPSNPKNLKICHICVIGWVTWQRWQEMAFSDFEGSPGAPRSEILHVELPAATSPEVQRAAQIALNKAVRILGPALLQDADRLAALIVGLATPTSNLVKQRVERRRVISTLTVETEWISALELQETVDGHPRVVADWKRRGRIFGVTGPDGKDLFPAYQFDGAMRPLPVVADILKRFGPVSDPWPLIAWFHTPNMWLVRHDDRDRRYVAPKNFLHDAGALRFALQLRDRKAEALDIRPPPAP